MTKIIGWVSSAARTFCGFAAGPVGKSLATALTGACASRFFSRVTALGITGAVGAALFAGPSAYTAIQRVIGSFSKPAPKPAPESPFATDLKDSVNQDIIPISQDVLLAVVEAANTMPEEEFFKSLPNLIRDVAPNKQKNVFADIQSTYKTWAMILKVNRVLTLALKHLQPEIDNKTISEADISTLMEVIGNRQTYQERNLITTEETTSINILQVLMGKLVKNDLTLLQALLPLLPPRLLLNKYLPASRSTTPYKEYQ